MISRRSAFPLYGIHLVLMNVDALLARNACHVCRQCTESVHKPQLTFGCSTCKVLIETSCRAFTRVFHVFVDRSFPHARCRMFTFVAGLPATGCRPAVQASRKSTSDVFGCSLQSSKQQRRRGTSLRAVDVVHGSQDTRSPELNTDQGAVPYLLKKPEVYLLSSRARPWYIAANAL